ncbi:MAG: hypothetical protein WBC45_06955 [Atribacterota bacterium]|jgi:hypothetical protein
MINDRVGRSTLLSDDGCSLLKNGGGEAFTPKSILSGILDSLHCAILNI